MYIVGSVPFQCSLSLKNYLTIRMTFCLDYSDVFIKALHTLLWASRQYCLLHIGEYPISLSHMMQAEVEAKVKRLFKLSENLPSRYSIM